MPWSIPPLQSRSRVVLSTSGCAVWECWPRPRDTHDLQLSMLQAGCVIDPSTNLQQCVGEGCVTGECGAACFAFLAGKGACCRSWCGGIQLVLCARDGVGVWGGEGCRAYREGREGDIWVGGAWQGRLCGRRLKGGGSVFKATVGGILNAVGIHPEAPRHQAVCWLAHSLLVCGTGRQLVALNACGRETDIAVLGVACEPGCGA